MGQSFDFFAGQHCKLEAYTQREQTRGKHKGRRQVWMGG